MQSDSAGTGGRSAAGRVLWMEPWLVCAPHFWWKPLFSVSNRNIHDILFAVLY